MRNVFQEVYLLNALLKITTLTFLTNTMMDRERWLKLTEQLHFSFAWMCVEYFYFKEELLNFFIMSWCSCSRGNNFTKWARGGCTFWGLWPFFSFPKQCHEDLSNLDLCLGFLTNRNNFCLILQIKNHPPFPSPSCPP